MGDSWCCLAGLQAGARARSYTKDVRRQLRASQGDGRHNIGSLIALNDPSRPMKDFYSVETFQQLGTGGFGQVYRATHKATQRERAVKRIEKGETNPRDMVSNELVSLLELDHPHVCKIYEWFEDEFSVYIVTELVSGKELGAYMQDSKMNVLFRQMLTAVAYCHGKGIAHRDLKMENCLVVGSGEDDLSLKVIDFGLAAIKKGADADLELNITLGTPMYMSPAVVCNKTKYGVKCDVWSAGIILYMLLTTEHPFCECAGDGKDLNLLFSRIKGSDFRRKPLVDQGATIDEIELVDVMLRKNANERPSATELLQKYSWLSSKSKTPCGIRTKKQMTWATVYTKKADKFEKMLLSVIARLATSKDLADARASFDQFDRDHDGKLCKKEIAQAFESCGVTNCSATIATIFDALDTDGSGHVEYTQFLAATLEPNTIASKDAAVAAMEFLRTGSNGVSRSDLERFIGAPEADEVLKRWDKDRDDVLNIQELFAVLNNIAERRRQSTRGQ
eukprot:TRINITY_DN5070_c3_g2_i1.p1 TRINITY_DN5070_c3_g2~~TRINITY_DN5070_c3_g2_i1.p1  ORF type:complete len:506 (+),score=101.58 TRINITY_DN5070_c3_g2_i1:240-1757(+)